MTFKETYFKWLIKQVTETYSGIGYSKLFHIMYNTPFVWVVVGDKNRMADALELRDEYVTEFDLTDPEIPIGWLKGSPSVLEVLIRFSRRAEFNSLGGESAEWWFWHFLDNLGLSRFKRVVSDNDLREIDEILYRFIWREYDYNGKGGMFPLNRATKNQTQVEIWYQFNAYLQDTG